VRVRRGGGRDRREAYGIVTVTGGPDNAGFGGEDLAYQAAQRANLASAQTIDANAYGRYETAIPDNLGPRVITISAGHVPVETVASDSAAVLQVELRLCRVVIKAMVDRIACLSGQSGVDAAAVAACLKDVNWLARQAVEMT
jgi:hypothetical protein